ncbi:MAG: hypothetical protein GOV00_02595 [Candidatus Altiarchaeota archaeon]|nr:hypothetical protein [Candidatus Altiarchaeota archaeon]
MYPEILDTALKIKSREIKGIKTVARTSLEALAKVVDDKKFMLNRDEAVMALIKPGSPLAFNFLRTVMKADSPAKVKKLIKFGLNYLETVRPNVVKNSLDLVAEGDTILTIAHASNVMAVLLEASKHKTFEVFVVKSMPNEKGVKTAEELKDAGIKITLIGDTAVNYFMPEVRKVIVGGVAITKFGLIDHIGTSAVAVCANFNRIPFYSCVEYLKVSDRLIVDERPRGEISEVLPVRNPAYDLTRTSLITEYITDLGRVEPAKFYETARQKVEELIE